MATGERLAVVGENGAGKSSLMNILFGLYRPDRGELWVDGKPVRLQGPEDAIALGIGMVHQHFKLVPSLSVAENVVLGREPVSRGLFDFKRACSEVEQTCRRYRFVLDPRARVGELTVGAQQKVEIIKALHRGATTLILDEPTAVLTPAEAKELLTAIGQLSDGGLTVVLVSHKLKEVLAFAQRVVVMRKGKVAADVRAEDTDVEQLSRLVLGLDPDVVAPVAGNAVLAVLLDPAKVSDGRPQTDKAPAPDTSRMPGRGEAASDAVVPGRATHARDARLPPAGTEAQNARKESSAPYRLEARGLETAALPGRPRLRGVDLRLRPGTLTGVAGVDGNGQRELSEALTGLLSLTSGEVRIDGRLVAPLTPRESKRQGVALIPEDRLRTALISSMSAEENFALGRQGQPPFARGPLIDVEGRRQRTLEVMRAFDVRPLDPRSRVGDLSGGNQQKLVVGRELESAPLLMVAVQPTRGLDLGAVAAVHQHLRAVCARGGAVLLFSLDLDELLTLCDRIEVLYGGRFVGGLDRLDFDERRLGALMMGAHTELADA